MRIYATSVGQGGASQLEMWARGACSRTRGQLWERENADQQSNRRLSRLHPGLTCHAKKRCSALGAKSLFDNPRFERLPPVYLITAIDGYDIALFEKSRESKGATRSLLALKAIADRHPIRFTIHNDGQWAASAGCRTCHCYLTRRKNVLGPGKRECMHHINTD